MICALFAADVQASTLANVPRVIASTLADALAPWLPPNRAYEYETRLACPAWASGENATELPVSAKAKIVRVIGIPYLVCVNTTYEAETRIFRLIAQIKTQ